MIGQNISALALLCRTEDLCPDCVVEYLHQATAGGKQSIALYEEPLLKVQKAYAECIGHLRTFPAHVREKIHEIITYRTEFFRYGQLLPAFDRDILKMEGEIQNRGKEAKRLQDRISNGIGDKVEQKGIRTQLLIDNSSSGTKLNEVRSMREEVAVRVQRAFTQANLARAQLAKESSDVNMPVFKSFEKIIEEREKIKAQFFLQNGWAEILVDCKAQNEFDAVLRAAVPPPLTFWQWVCCCLRKSTSKTH